MPKRLFFIFLVIALFCTVICAQDEGAAKTIVALPKPDIANGKYGTYDANTFDLWKPKSNKPTPLVVYIHGGGLIRGDKSMLSAKQLEQMLDAGLAVMAINYRLTGEAVFPQHYMDCARAIQYARYHAKDFNIDPKRVAATGSSAGGMTSLWIGFHDDLADPKNADPVLRESTRLRAMAVFSAQTTLVPDVVTKYIGPLVTQYKTYYDGRAFGVTPEVMRSAKGLELYKAASPLTYLTKDDPAVWAFYSVPNKEPSTPSEAIHHPGFGVVLKEEMDKLGIECKLRHKDDGKNVNGDMVEFLQRYLK
ncbi:MAG TPA: alpha/beta hydrolase [Pyrinomonadaceae bacterium]|nr:alpha/beta hydrolase [Pyrinomonadaceae bacterium]